MTFNFPPSVNPLNLVPQNPVNIVSASRDPISSDNIYSLGTEWQNTTSGDFFKLITTSYMGVVGNAFWDQFASQTIQEVQQVTTNSGVAKPTLDGNLNIVGTATSGIISIGTGSTVTLGMNSPFVGDFTFRSTTSGSLELLVVENTSNTANSSSQIQINVAGVTAANPTLQFNVTGATTWTTGIDNSASDAYKISSSTTVGTNNRFAISTTGAVTFNNAFTFPTTDGSNNQVLTTNGAGVVSWQTNKSGFSAASITVSPIAGEGDFTTIGAALAAAVSGNDILIKAGTYTENLTLKAGVNLVSWSANAFSPMVTIIGKCSASFAGSAGMSGIKLQTNGDYCLEMTGANNTALEFINCYFYAQNFSAIHYAATGAPRLDLHECTGDTGTTGVAYIVMNSTGGLKIFGGDFENNGLSSTSTTVSSGSLQFYGVDYFANNIQTSGTGFFTSSRSVIVGTVVIGGTTGADSLIHTSVSAGSSSAISIGTGATCVIADSAINSSNTNAITGLGTLNAGIITFTGSSSTINTSTVNKLTTYGGTII